MTSEISRFYSFEGVRNVLILFLGLNIAWIETSVNAIITGGVTDSLCWPPFDACLAALDWFWIHFALTIICTAVLVYLYEWERR